MLETEINLAELVERGGMHLAVKGTIPQEVLGSFIGMLPQLPSLPAETLLEAVLEREALMPTGIGNGIALPHPRNPLAMAEREQFTALAFLEHPIDWNSLDGKRVDTLLLIVSASAGQHLKTLSRINYLCRQGEFSELLRKRPPLSELLEYIREAEKSWK